MQLLQRMEGGVGLLVGDGAKMDDLKNTGFWGKVQGEQEQSSTSDGRDKGRNQSGNRDTSPDLCSFSKSPPKKAVPRAEKADDGCVFMQLTRCETPI